MNPTRIVLDLPFPPSVNHYYTRTRYGLTIGTRGLQFRKETAYLSSRQVARPDRFGAEKRLYVSVAAFPPDHRKRDLDNLNKCLLDALTHAGIYVDDSQIDHLESRRKCVQKNYGRVIVTIEEIEGVEVVEKLSEPKISRAKKARPKAVKP